MLLKLIELFNENNCKLLIKYDGERIYDKFTIRILYSSPDINNLGKDTDEPLSELNDVLNTIGNFFEEEICNLFVYVSNNIISPIKLKFGNESVVVFYIGENNKNIIYTLSFFTNIISKQIISEDLQEIIKELDYYCKIY